MTLYPSRPPPPPNSHSSEHVNCSLTLLAYALFVFSTCGPRRLYAALAAFMRPSPPSCGPRRLHAAFAAFTRPSPNSCGPRRLLAGLAAFVQPLLPPCGRCRPLCGLRRLCAALAAFMRSSLLTSTHWPWPSVLQGPLLAAALPGCRPLLQSSLPPVRQFICVT